MYDKTRISFETIVVIDRDRVSRKRLFRVSEMPALRELEEIRPVRPARSATCRVVSDNPFKVA